MKKKNEIEVLFENLRSKYGFSYKQIFDLLQGTKIQSPGISVPLSLFRERKLGMLEHTVVYLKDSEKLRFTQIAKLLNRDQRTIWVTYNKGKNKLKK